MCSHDHDTQGQRRIFYGPEKSIIYNNPRIYPILVTNSAIYIITDPFGAVLRPAVATVIFPQRALARSPNVKARDRDVRSSYWR